MTQLGCAIAFTLGVAIAIRVIAALYGIVDFWFAIRTWYPRVLRDIVGWCGAALLVAALLDRPYRTAFGLGLLAFALGYVSLYGLRHLVVRPLTPPDAAPRPPAGPFQSIVRRVIRRGHCVTLLACVVGAGVLGASSEEKGSMQPSPRISFVAGPATTPAEAALAHLDGVGAEAPPRRVRLPVALLLDEARSAIVGARLGSAADAPPLRLDDGRLGIGLADRASALCAVGAPCVLRLVGHWHGRTAGVGQFEVLQADGAVMAGELERIEVEVRADAGPESAAGRRP